MTARVESVHRSPEHGFSKESASQIDLVAGLGVVGDAHQGARVRHRSRVVADPSRPNLRQIHLIHAELFDLVADQGFEVAPGDLGENITTAGIDLLGLPTGTVLAIGTDAIVAITGLRNPCRQIESFREGLLSAVLASNEDGSLERLAGIMAVVVRGGTIRPGDGVEVALPPEPWHSLEPV